MINILINIKSDRLTPMIRLVKGHNPQTHWIVDLEVKNTIYIKNSQVDFLH